MNTYSESMWRLLMKKYNLAIVFALALSLVLTACSSGGTGGSSSGSTSIDVKMSDFKFTPDTWTVSAGKEVTINLSNSGAVTHDWALMLKPVEGTFSADKQGDVVAQFKLDAGKTESVKFTAPTTAGEYQVICAIPGHLEAGMVGKLIVK
jgi:uncharacterized cupredoxin-like copper-binding protein